MNSQNYRFFKPLVLIPFLLLLSSCTAGDPQFSQDSSAGFWYGLWHGIISVITLIIHVFNENVAVYEINNTGGWYDFGFLVGVICIWGGGSHASGKSSARRQQDKDWEEIGDKVELKVMRKLKELNPKKTGMRLVKKLRRSLNEKFENGLRRIKVKQVIKVRLNIPRCSIDVKTQEGVRAQLLRKLEESVI